MALVGEELPSRLSVGWAVEQVLGSDHPILVARPEYDDIHGLSLSDQDAPERHERVMARMGDALAHPHHRGAATRASNWCSREPCSTSTPPALLVRLPQRVF